MFRIQLARQGQTMEQGTLVRWMRAVGDELVVGEELYEIENEKAVIAIEVTRPGRLLKILVAEGDIVPVGAVLAIAAAPGEAVSDAAVAAYALGTPAAEGDAGTKPAAEAAAATQAGAAAGAKLAVMPKARALAAELGVDLATVTGTGANGTIVPDDVRRAAKGVRPAAAKTEPPPAVGSAPRREPMTAIHRSIVGALEKAWLVPQFTQGILIDATALAGAREAAGDRLSYMDFFIDAIVRAAQSVPEVLARVADRDVLRYDTVDVSIATTTPQGLMVPVLRDAGALATERRAQAWRELVERARAGRLAAEDMSGGMICLSNLGTRGVDYGTPLLPLGHSAIVFVGSLDRRALAVGAGLEARPSLHVSITYDHRVVDGVLGARYTGALREALLAPVS